MTSAMLLEATTFAEVRMYLRDVQPRFTPRKRLESVAAVNMKASRQSRGVAHLQLFGLLENRLSMLGETFGGTDLQRFGQSFDRVIADPSISSVLIEVDSPGGEYSGTPEIADKVYRGRSVKPVVAVINSLGASAAYWISSQASEIVVTPSGEAGSIGVFLMHIDESAAMEKAGYEVTFFATPPEKISGNPYQPPSPAAAEFFMRRSKAIYSEFTAAVARGRGVSQAQVIQGMGGGLLMGAKEAKAARMVDAVMPFDAAVAAVLSKPGARASVGVLHLRKELQELRAGV